MLNAGASARHDLALRKAVSEQEWEYEDADTQQLTHAIHRYSGKFIPQIAARAIELLSEPNELILDIYCGSGTTLIEAAVAGRRALGCDLSPLAVLISKAKTTPVPAHELMELARSFEVALASNDGPSLFGSELSGWLDRAQKDQRLEHNWYRKWFQSNVLIELLAIDLMIRELADEPLRNIARVAFSEILRRSSNAHSGYPNVMFDKLAPEKQSPIGPFLRALRRIVQMVGSLETAGANWSGVDVLHADARSIPLEDEFVDAIVSHPPYIGSIPYAEYGSLSLTWLGADVKALDAQLTGGKRQTKDVVDRFRTGYGLALKEATRVLKPGRCAFLMVGNPVVKGELIDLAEMTIELGEQAGLALIASAQRTGMNRRANKMGAEHLLFFRKLS